MKKLVLIFLAIMLIIPAYAGIASAQTGKVGPELQVVIPVGDWGDVTGVGIGGNARFEYAFMPSMAATASVGYIYGLDKNGFSMSEIPFMLGFKYTMDFGLFGEASIGLSNIRSKFSAFGFSGTSSTTKASLGLGVGYIWNNIYGKAGVYWPSVGDISTMTGVSITAGYLFDIF